MTDLHSSEPFSITVYSKPSCVQCNATMRALDRRGVTYNVVNLTEDPAALDRLRSMGHLSAPVVVAGTESWSGFQPDRIAAITRESTALV